MNGRPGAPRARPTALRKTPARLIDLHGVEKTYWMGHTPVRALRGVTLTIGSGEFVAIMGPSGSGKSTLMHVLGLLDGYDAGRYVLDGQDTRGLTEDDLAALRARAIGFVFQQFNLLPRLDVLANIGLPLLYAGREDGARAADAGAPADLAKMLGLASRADHRPGELSGGQQQRVAIARSLVNRPRLILADEPTGNLDSKTQREIMDLLVRLNRAGLTVIVVTHEEEVARYARRIIWMRDGLVRSDRRQTPPRSLGGPGAPVAVSWTVAPAAPPAPVRAAGWRAAVAPARPVLAAAAAHLGEAARSLAGNKMRTFLSTLGITIGVAGVIAMQAVGDGAKQSMAQQMSRFGTNMMSVRPNWWRPGGQRGGGGSATRLTIEDAEAVRKAHPGIARTAAVYQIWNRCALTANGKNWTARMLEGVVPEYAEMRNNRPVSGRYVTAMDIRNRSRVCLVGRTVYRELFGGTGNPLGREIRINRIPFVVIGVLPEKGANAWNDADDLVHVPISTAMYRLAGERYIGSIDVEVKGGVDMDEAIEAVKQFLLRRYRLAGKRDDAFDIRNEVQFREMLSAVTNTTRLLILVVSGLSLVVGGIGIMNIMLVTVTERTREIGLRKALGARPRDILWQFLVEATTVSVSGGVVGILIGAGAALLIGGILGWAILITVSTVAVSFGISVAVGIISGFWPALRASRLHPAVALRSE